MIEDRDIICFCNDWTGDPLSKKQIVTRLARHNRILWVNSTGNRNPTASARDLGRAWNKLMEFGRGCRQVAHNIHVFSPLVIPFHGSRAARAFNRRFYAACLRAACRRLEFHDPLVLTFVPSSAGVADSLGARLVVYYCVDEYAQFSGTNRDAILAMERKLMAHSGLVIVSAERLLANKRAYNPNTFLITHGVDVDHFRKACLAATEIPADCPRPDGPLVGFFGLIEDWVDLPLIREVAMARPAWTFVLIGEARTDTSALTSLPNVRLLGRRPYQSLPGYCRAFDAAILPFVWNELTLAANPLKLREYLAAGLPVVATPLPEVSRLGHLVHLARTPAEYLDALERILAAPRRGPCLADSLRMNAESWDCKVEQLSGYIAEALAGGRARHGAALVSA